MKKLILFALLFCSFGFAERLHAQFSAGAEVVLPLGDFGDVANAGFGASLGYDYAATEKLKIGGLVGYTFLLVDDVLGDLNLSMIPVQASIKYGVSEKAYLQGLLGIHAFRASADLGGAKISETESEFSFGLGAGVTLGKVDLSARFQLIEDSNYIGARVAYLFGG
jgi:hypothetical protein